MSDSIREFTRLRLQAQRYACMYQNSRVTNEPFQSVYFEKYWDKVEKMVPLYRLLTPGAGEERAYLQVVDIIAGK